MKLEKKIVDEMLAAAYTAGRFISSKIDKVAHIDYKTGFNNIVTDVDKKSEELIVGRLTKAFPEFDVLGEEFGDRGRSSSYKWVIDPIDGTTNFAHRFPFFCVSIGLEYKGEVIAGAVYDPNRDEMFHAVKGKGAFLNKKRIKVSSVDNLNHSLLSTGFSYHLRGVSSTIKEFKRLLKVTQAIRRPGSAALDLCYVACGRLDGYWERGLSPWDAAAGTIIIKEAGGKITKLNGAKYSHYDKEVFATNGLIHASMKKVLQK